MFITLVYLLVGFYDLKLHIAFVGVILEIFSLVHIILQVHETYFPLFVDQALHTVNDSLLNNEK